MLEKIIAGLLIGTTLSFGSCTKEEPFSKNQAIEITRETPSPKIKQKVSKLKEFYKEKEYFQARELAKEIIMTDKTNLEANILLLHINWIVRNHTGEIGELNPNSQYHDMKIFRRLTYNTEDPTFLLEEILKEPNLRIPIAENMFGKVSDWSTIHDEVKHILNSLYISSEEANKKNISIISRIKDSPSAWLGHCKTWEDEDGFIHNKKDIIIEGTVIYFGEEGGPLDIIGKYFILKDKFNQEIKVCYKNKPKLRERITVDVEKIFTVNAEPVLISKENINEPTSEGVKESQDLMDKFDSPEKTLEYLIKTVSTKIYSEEKLKSFLTKSTSDTIQTQEDYKKFVSEREIDCLEILKDYKLINSYFLSEKARAVISEGTIMDGDKKRDVYILTLLINEYNEWKLHGGAGVADKERILRSAKRANIKSINDYLEATIRIDLYEELYHPENYPSESANLLRKEINILLPKEDAIKSLERCKEIAEKEISSGAHTEKELEELNREKDGIKKYLKELEK